jgi:ATP-binding cassette subfamily B protein
VAYGENGKEPVSKETLVHAVTTAQAAEFVEEKPEGYDAFVAQGGTNFSGGQKQRLSIARAIARKPEIFIFDQTADPDGIGVFVDAVVQKNHFMQKEIFFTLT